MAHKASDLYHEAEDRRKHTERKILKMKIAEQVVELYDTLVELNKI